MSRHEGDGRGNASMRDRNPGVCGRGDAGGDPGHDLERDASPRKRLCFLAAASENERIATLEAHDPFAFVGEADEQRVDLVLTGGLRCATTLPNVVELLFAEVTLGGIGRSEERRVGKECRSRW